MPRSGTPLVRWRLWRTSANVVMLTYRERGTGRGATIALNVRGAGALARALDGTRVCDTAEPATIETAGMIRALDGKAIQEDDDAA